jgi:glycosyltransferase involved in cell wall biosynthesis
LEELIRDGDTGLLCRADDAAALASVLVDLGAAPRQRTAIGARARRFVCDERDWTHLGKCYEHIYRGVMPAAIPTEALPPV